MTDYHVHLEAIAWGRAPTYSNGRTAHRILCADGFSISVQASPHHYADDSHPTAEAPYWIDRPIEYPWVAFEVAYPSEPITGWPEPDDGSTALWSWVPKEQVAQLLTEHGGTVGWITNEEMPGPGLEAQSADRASGTYTTWPCPDCGTTVPVTATVEHVAVARLDPTDIHAHRLTHQEQPR